MRKRSNNTQVFWRFALIFFGFISPALAQSTSTILGVVKDSSGGVVAGATITVQNTDTAQIRTVTTSEDGSFRVPALQAGHYSLRVERAGFKTATRPDLPLDVAQELAVNMALEVGASTQEIVVNEVAPQVDTSTSSLGGLVNDREIADLPLNGRNYIDLSLMQAGVTKNTNQGGLAGMTGTTYSSNGAPIVSNNYLLDGTSIVNASGWGPTSLAGSTLGVDGIKEYKVVTSAFSAEYGMSMGSQMVMVSKSGTNQFHGDAFEYLRNSSLDARNYFDTTVLVDGRRLPLLQRNNFGGALGGPIKKDKTFFFGVYESIKLNQGFTVLDTVPSAACKGAAGTTIIAGTGAAQCPLITSNTKVSPLTAPLMALYPNPDLPGNLGSAGAINNYTFNTANHTTVQYGQMRVDQNFSSSDTLFGRYTVNLADISSPTSSPTAFAGTAFPYNRQAQGSLDQWITLSENHIFSPTLLNTARISFSRSGFFTGGDKVFTVPGLPIIQTGISDFGGLTIGSGGGFVNAALTGATVAHPEYVTHQLQNIYSIADDVFYTRGKHGLKFGFLGNRFNQWENQLNAAGSVAFANYTNFLNAIPLTYSYSTINSNTDRDFIYNTLGLYAQDDWRLASRFTLNIGLRYEFNTTPRELNGKEYELRGHLTQPVASNCVNNEFACFIHGPIMRDRSYLNFSPRLGFAWDVFGDGKTSVRGAAGIYYDIGNFHNLFVQNSFGGPPLLISVSHTNSTNAPLSLPYTATPADFGTIIQGMVDYDAYQPHILQINASIERQLPKNLALTLAYVHTRGAHLWTALEGNPSSPVFVAPDGTQYWSNQTYACAINHIPSCRTQNTNFDQIQLTTTAASSWYNALQVKVDKRLGHGLQFQANYTWAHSMDTTENTLSISDCNGSGMDESSRPTNLRADLAPSCFDVRHNVRFNLLYHFPSIQSTGFLSKLLNGWWTGSIVSAEGGYPLTPVSNNNRSLSGVLPNAKPFNVNLGTATQTVTIGGKPVTFVPFNANTVITGNPNQWYNPLMFTLQPWLACPNNPSAFPSVYCGTLGTVPRGLLRGPGLGTWDFSLVKDTKMGFLGEAGSVQFRAELFNTPNRANFAVPSGVVFNGNPLAAFAANSSSYAEAPTPEPITTTVTTSRQIQLALKILF